MTGKHHNFHKRWTVDMAANTATHESGLLVTFTPHPAGGYEGTTDDANTAATFAILKAKNGAGNAAAMIPRLMREAGEVFGRALQKE
jgi:hypothetical protein